eukprot:5179072-Pyramimonas_sp.AAC.1
MALAGAVSCCRRTRRAWRGPGGWRWSSLPTGCTPSSPPPASPIATTTSGFSAPPPSPPPSCARCDARHTKLTAHHYKSTVGATRDRLS